MIRVLVMTSDTYSWCLKPYAYLFNLFWSSLQAVRVCGYTPPSFPLPPNYEFYQIDSRNYPSDMWSDGLIRSLEAINDELIVLMLEDYLLQRGVDHEGVASLANWMHDHPDALRMDLTADRLYGMNMKDKEAWGRHDIVECSKDAPYQMSLQAAIWNRRNLLATLRPGLSAWAVETQIDMTNCPYGIYGTRQWPVRYANLILKGSVMDYELDRIPQPHRDTIRRWIK